MSSHHTEAKTRYSLSCLCSHCSAQTFIVFGRSCYTEQEFVMRAKRYRLNEEQQKVVDELKLKLWNDATRGEKAG